MICAPRCGAFRDRIGRSAHDRPARLCVGPPNHHGTGTLTGRAFATPSFAAPRWRDLVILCVYGYQGLVAGFGVTAVPNWQAGLGASTTEIGAAVAMAGLPWTLQPLWGPVVDRHPAMRMGRRRFFVLLGMAGALAALASLPLAGEGRGALVLIGPILLLHSIFAALTDTAMDGWIIDRVPADALGRATALTRMGFATGIAGGAALFSWAIPALGFGASSAILLMLVAMVAGVPLAVRDRPGDALLSPWRVSGAVPMPTGTLLRNLLREMTARHALLLLLLCILYEGAVGAFGVRLAVDMVQGGGWDGAAVSRLQGLLVLAGGTVGALAVGWWSDRAGPHRALLALLGGCIAAYLATSVLLALAPLSSRAAGLALALSGVAPALFFVALAPAVMIGSRGATAASRFALFMAALNLGGVIGAAIAGPVGTVTTPAEHALAAAAVFGACALLAARPRLLFLQTAAPGRKISGAADP